jgi:hypothetical protein
MAWIFHGAALENILKRPLLAAHSGRALLSARIPQAIPSYGTRFSLKRMWNFNTQFRIPFLF